MPAPSVCWTLRDWTLTLRPIVPEDEPLWLELMKTMSWATRYKRGARRVEELTPEDVRRAVTLDPSTEAAYVVIGERGAERRMAGVSRGTRRDDDLWSFTLVVLDEWQRRGIGRRLMRALIDDVRGRDARSLEGEVLATNRNMLEFVARLGFRVEPIDDHPQLKRVVLRLGLA